MTNFLGYLLGIIAHAAFKWAMWKRPHVTWLAYWDGDGRPIARAVAALVMFTLWNSGLLVRIISAGLGEVFGAKFEVAVSFGTSVLAGYIVDSFAMNVLATVGKRLGGDEPGNGDA